MFLSYVNTMNYFDSSFFKNGYGSCLMFFIYSLLLEVDKKQIETVEKILFGGYITFYFFKSQINWFCYLFLAPSCLVLFAIHKKMFITES